MQNDSIIFQEALVLKAFPFHDHPKFCGNKRAMFLSTDILALVILGACLVSLVLEPIFVCALPMSAH